MGSDVGGRARSLWWVWARMPWSPRGQRELTVLCCVTQPCLTLCDTWTAAHQARLSIGVLQARLLEWVAMPSSRGSSQARGRTRSPTLQAGYLPSEPPGKLAEDLKGVLTWGRGALLLHISFNLLLKYPQGPGDLNSVQEGKMD